MAAYGAATSLKKTIEHILQSSRISLSRPSREILLPAYTRMPRLQKLLLKLDETGYSKIRTKVNALDERIKEAIWEFEDLLESHLLDQILPQLESSSPGERDHLSFNVDLQSLGQRLDNLLESLTPMVIEYAIELIIMPEEEGEPISSRIDFRGINSEMVGLSDQFAQVRNDLLAQDKGNRLLLTGMAGVGKTTLAKKVFDDPMVQRHFEHRAWVKVGRKCGSNEILRCILLQVDPSTLHQMLTHRDDDDNEKLLGLLRERLKDKKFLIVLDDVWEWDTLLMDNLPQENIRILLTSRQQIADPALQVRFLDEEESKKLLGEKMFGDQGFPPHLEKLAEKIAKKCERLPLMIVTVRELLSKEDETQECWTMVAEKQHNSVFEDAYDKISEVFFPSYEYLPQPYKMFFLYFGAELPYHNIHVRNFIHRLSAEGFLEPFGNQTFVDLLSELAFQYHLVMFESNPEDPFLKQDCRVHSCWQHLCRKEASKIKFLHVLQSWDDILEDQRRLGAHHNNLFSFKQVCESIKSDCASTTRSLLCYGPLHQHPVPIEVMDFKLLRVLDALRVRFYHIPLEIMKLIYLKYLALTCNKELPVSISNLFHLQFLSIHPHMKIQKRGTHSYMPVEIWNMQELQHIEVLGSDLPTPDSDGILEKLSNLIGVSPNSCTRKILKKIPNLKALLIDVELKPYDDDDDSNPLSSLGYISEELQNLDVLVYRIQSPEMKYKPMVPLSMFPSSLTRLELSGLGCSWEHMNDIGSLLPNLTFLRLQQYAFRGLEWNIQLGCFLNLKDLIIEDADLVRWRPQHGSLPKLELLKIYHCYKLQHLDWTADPSTVTITVVLDECNPLVISSAMQLPRSRVYWRSSFWFPNGISQLG